MDIIGMVRAFFAMKGAINLAFLGFLWSRETDKKMKSERIKTIVEHYGVRISNDDHEAWMHYVIQCVELDEVLNIGLVEVAKAKIREVYAEMYAGYDKKNLDFVADLIVKNVEMELKK